MYWLLNPIVRFLLRSPFQFLLSKNTLLITFSGRKSGRLYTVPVSYIQDGSRVRCFTGSPWWRNLQGGRQVTLRLRGRNRSGIANVERDDIGAVAQGLTDLLHRVRRDRYFYKIRIDAAGQLHADDLATTAQRTVMISIDLQDQ